MEERIMKRPWMTTLAFVCMVMLAALVCVGCDDDDDDDGAPRDGMLENRTPYQIRVNFMGIKIVELPANGVVRESALEQGKTYQVQVTVFDAAGAALEVVNSSAYIDKDADDRVVASQTCSWYLRVWGESVPFTIESAS